MRLMAISTTVAGAGLCLREDARLLGEWRGPGRSGPGPILAAARELLAAAGLEYAVLDGIAFGRGPGAFTGIRLGVALAQGLALGAGIPLVPVSDLAAVARDAFYRHAWPCVLACIDARQGEVYWGAFACTGGRTEPVGEERIEPLASGSWPAGPEWAWAGSGAGLLTGIPADAPRDPEASPTARAIADLGMEALAAGRTALPEAAMPRYLRDRVAEPSPRYRRRRELGGRRDA